MLFSFASAFDLAIGNERFFMAFLMIDRCNYLEIDKSHVCEFLNYEHKPSKRNSSYHKLVHMLRGQLINELGDEAKETDQKPKEKEKMSFHDGCPTCMELVKEPIRERD